MPTYDYECGECGLKFERRQAMSEAPLDKCPGCGGKVRRLPGAGGGFIVKGSGRDRPGCSLADSGTTCCGLDSPCGKSPCG